MLIDACAIVSLMTLEPTAPVYDEALSTSDDVWTSPLAAFEAILVLARPEKFDRSYAEVETIVLTFLDERGIALRDAGPAASVLAHAVAIADRVGVGRTKLSTFDCLHYAYAKTARAPLLTLDVLLRATDVETVP